MLKLWKLHCMEYSLSRGQSAERGVGRGGHVIERVGEILDRDRAPGVVVGVPDPVSQRGQAGDGAVQVKGVGVVISVDAADASPLRLEPLPLLLGLQLRQGILHPGDHNRVRGRFLQILFIFLCDFIVLAFSGERLRHVQV